MQGRTAKVSGAHTKRHDKHEKTSARGKGGGRESARASGGRNEESTGQTTTRPYLNGMSVRTTDAEHTMVQAERWNRCHQRLQAKPYTVKGTQEPAAQVVMTHWRKGSKRNWNKKPVSNGGSQRCHHP